MRKVSWEKLSPGMKKTWRSKENWENNGPQIEINLASYCGDCQQPRRGCSCEVKPWNLPNGGRTTSSLY